MALLSAHDMVQCASDILKCVKYVLVCLYFNKSVELHWGIWVSATGLPSSGQQHWMLAELARLAPLISSTSKFDFIKIPQIFTTQRWIRELFLHSLHNLKLDQQNYEYRKAFSAAQSPVLLLWWFMWEAELPATHCSKNLPWKGNQHPG